MAVLVAIIELKPVHFHSSPSSRMYLRMSERVTMPLRWVVSSTTIMRCTRDFLIVSIMVERRSFIEHVYMPAKSYRIRR